MTGTRGPALAPEIAGVAPPNHLAPAELRLEPDDDGCVAVDPARAGWRYLSFRTAHLLAGQVLSLPADTDETTIVVLGGGGVHVAAAGSAALVLDGRRSVWDGLPWGAYLPSGTSATVTGSPLDHHGGVDIAIARAPRSGRLETSGGPVLIRPDDCTVEVRGAGNATRQITHIVPPDFPADRLLLVEVHTPSGNWSSWPPHKHDEDAMPGEAVLEEVYHYRFRRPDEDWAIQRLYRRPGTPAHRSSGSRDGLWVVRHGELVLVTDGYHPFVAPHGVDAYYLNALAGDRRTMACSFDPDLDFVRAEWATISPDPRVPLVDRNGPRTPPPGDPAGHA
jgi:5-deoxy-glucuronate isomerase